MLDYFEKVCGHLKSKQNYKGWQDGYHAEIIYTNEFIKQKVNYIHSKPVKDKTITMPEDYYFSSARNYAGLENDLDVVVLDLF
jgi:hypothetical protein